MTRLCSLHIVSSLRLSAGGPTQSVTRLCEALNGLGAPAEIATLSFPDDLPWEGATPIHKFPRGWPAKLHRSRQLAAFLREEIARFDLVHVHGLWEWPGLYARRAAEMHGKPLILSPRGMIEPWSLTQRSGTKRFARLLWEEATWRSASLFHTTSTLEARSVRAQGLRQPIAVIPNGVEAPAPVHRPASDRKRLLFLSRLHPKKGVEELLRAWVEIAPRHPDWDLWIAGPDEDGFGARMRALAARLRVPRVNFEGPVHGEAKWALLGSADLFILPSHSENFGNVIPEALSQGIPVLTTRGTPWEVLEAEGCGWWISLEALPIALDHALGLAGPELKAMGQRGMAWTTSTLRWHPIADRMVSTYAWLLGEGPQPECVNGTP